ncbi:MAG: sensor histidine kinase, partial [Caulobacteraceae bacterium]|nr:sensor histidine kinase [Caulobacteraceae bacterium]
SLLEGDRIAIRVEAIDQLVPIGQAASLGMIVNELVTNAVKYAYPSGEGGEVRVAFSREGRTLVLRVADDGVGLGSPGQGLGVKVVRSLVDQIGGMLSQSGPPGAVFEVRWPVGPVSPV